jgi:hypothetical protein
MNVCYSEVSIAAFIIREHLHVERRRLNCQGVTLGSDI